MNAPKTIKEYVFSSRVLLLFSIVALLLTTYRYLLYDRTAPRHGYASTYDWEETDMNPPAPTNTSTPPLVLVIGHLKSDDMSWLTSELPDIPTALYTVDDASAPLHPPANKGNEVMVYLTYLIDHYDFLPETMLFMHAHRFAWHNNDLLASDAAAMVRALRPGYVQRAGYANLRCHWEPGCPDWMHPHATQETPGKSEELQILDAWREIFPGEPVPERLAQPCCAQFAVSRAQALSMPRERYVRAREWLLATPLESRVSGRVWEYLWQFLFTGRAVVCERMDVCYCEGFGICFGGRELFDQWFEMRAEKRSLEHVVELREEGEVDEDERSTEELVGRIEDLRAVLDERLQAAFRRGEEQENRAMDSGIHWKVN